jgi:hypothetical protein
VGERVGDICGEIRPGAVVLLGVARIGAVPFFGEKAAKRVK